MIGPGTRLTLTGSERKVVIWAMAPGPGNYWAHLDDQMVMVHVAERRAEPHPIVTLKEG